MLPDINRQKNYQVLQNLKINNQYQKKNNKMGGDAFDKSLGITRLTNQQFQRQTQEISKLIQPLCQKHQIYIPMPEKETHGDIDFLVILKENCTLSMLSYAINSNESIISRGTINCIYNKHQVDFKNVATDEEFQMTKFYKSYSAIGYILGYFTHSCNIKLSEHGLYAFMRDVAGKSKIQYFLTNDIKKICEVYGVDYKQYASGFKTLDELMRFLVSSKYFNLHMVLDKSPQKPNKLWKAFQYYCNQNKQMLWAKSNQTPSDLFEGLMGEFNLYKDHIAKVESMIKQNQFKALLKQKFNGNHIQQYFGLKHKQIGAAKRRFQQSFSSKQQLNRFIKESDLSQILAQFRIRAIDK